MATMHGNKHSVTENMTEILKLLSELMQSTHSDIIVIIAANIETTKTVDRSPAAKQMLVSVDG